MIANSGLPVSVIFSSRDICAKQREQRQFQSLCGHSVCVYKEFEGTELTLIEINKIEELQGKKTNQKKRKRTKDMRNRNITKLRL